jgi:hypothetical protein
MPQCQVGRHCVARTQSLYTGPGPGRTAHHVQFSKLHSVDHTAAALQLAASCGGRSACSCHVEHLPKFTPWCTVQHYGIQMNSCLQL